ncbi:Histone-lysine N-methyltransferase 2B [Mortierella sp. GBA30]|nr:Histone-lysine N-methyltransferase 2B [Mortierella sp. GBA30]
MDNNSVTSSCISPKGTPNTMLGLHFSEHHPDDRSGAMMMEQAAESFRTLHSSKHGERTHRLSRSLDPLTNVDMGWRGRTSLGGSSSSAEWKADEPMQPSGPYRSMEDMTSRYHHGPSPSQPSGYSRSHSNKSHPALLSPVANTSVPSPLASPVTATVNSLTALSISTPYGFSGRDLTKITVPRERKSTRPYSVSSSDAQLTQERKRSSRKDDTRHDQTERLSDSESSTRLEDVATRHGTHSVVNTPSALPSPSPSSSTSATLSATGSKSTGKWHPQKSAAQLRVTLYNLVSTGYLPADTLVIFREHSATVTAKGMLIPRMKEPDAATLYPWLQSEYETPSAWATAMVKGDRTGKVAVNGWSAIKVPIEQDATLSAMFGDQGTTEVSLDALRKRYLAEIPEEGTQPEAAPVVPSKAAVLDRKKRKRPSVRSAESAGLWISTQTGPLPSRGKSEAVRPRKRTMSDLSGMVTSDLFQDRQLHLEAAGALFSMQDKFTSPALDVCNRRGTKARLQSQNARRPKGSIQLESLARRRNERNLLRSQLQIQCSSALRAVKPASLVPMVVPHQPSSLAHMEFCVSCGASGEISDSGRHIPTQRAENDSLSQWSIEHTGTGGCDPRDDGHYWRCPRCTTCDICQKSVHEAPPSYHKAATLAHHFDSGAEEILVLTCDKCRIFAHLQCQLTLEPSLKDTLRFCSGLQSVEWLCGGCRECVECGYRIPLKSAEGTGELELTEDAESSMPSNIKGRWSHGCALCPSCTVLTEKGNICPLCCRTYSDDDYETPMIFCDGCSLWVHVACDKGLQDRDYEELGEDSRQYFCPSCIPTPIPSPTYSSSSSMFSAVNSVEQSAWQEAIGYGSHRTDSNYDHSREASLSNEDDGKGRKRKDDIMDLIRAAKEISDTESRANSPYSSYSPMFPPSAHSRTMSASLESVAEVAAAEALLTIFSGASTPVSSTPYTSYPPSPFEAPFGGLYDRHYSVINSPQDLPQMMGSMAFTPSSDQESSSSAAQECIGTAHCRCHQHRNKFPPEDYFNSWSDARQVAYHQIGNELQGSSAGQRRLSRESVMDSSDVIMEELQSEPECLDPLTRSISYGSGEAPIELYQPLLPCLQAVHGTSISGTDDTAILLNHNTVDTRLCVLCHGPSNVSLSTSGKDLASLGRLLPLRWRHDEDIEDSQVHVYTGWIHAQCALWSTGVAFDSTTGGISRVSDVVGQSMHAICSTCGQEGASIKCRAAASGASDNPHACTAVFHYPCIVRNRPSSSQQDSYQLRHQHNTNASRAVIVDHAQRTILCSMHYREVSTLNDLRTAAIALHSSMNSRDMESSKVAPSESIMPSAKPLTMVRGPVWIEDPVFQISDGESYQGTISLTKNERKVSGSFRIGGLMLHSLGSFEMPSVVYCETGLGNDIDLGFKYGLEPNASRNNARSSRAEVLALPLGFKCERQVWLDGSSRSTVVSEIVRSRLREVHPFLETSNDNEGDAPRATLAEVEEGLQWKIVISSPATVGAGSSHERVFYSDSMRDVVDIVFSRSSEDDRLKDDSPSTSYRHYLRSPDAFFGLDHPYIRRQILSMDGQRQVASRMWLRYREDQKNLERHCDKHGCTFTQGTFKAAQIEHSAEHRETMTAARARSRQKSRLSRRRIVRIGMARNGSYFAGNNINNNTPDNIISNSGSQTVDVKLNPNRATSSLRPGLSQQLVRAFVASPSPRGSKQGQPKLSQSKDTYTSFQKEERSTAVSEVAEDVLQKLRTEQAKGVALFWNGRRMTTPRTNVAPASGSRGDSAVLGIQLQDRINASTEDDTIPTSPSDYAYPKETAKGHDEQLGMEIDIRANPAAASISARESGAPSSRNVITGASNKEPISSPAHADLRLYTTCSFAADDMIMEYVGEIISPAVAIRRQEVCQSQGRGCYMMWCEFEEAVIDATVQGGPARCIRQHSGADASIHGGSVYAKLLTVVAGSGDRPAPRKSPRVIICAAKELKAGDELTMRYCS